MKIYKETEIDNLVNILKNDGIISVPTDTVYGLCGSINSLKAYKKLVGIKNRPQNKPFPIMCADLEQIKSIAKVDKVSEKIIKAFMPGPITIILEKKQDLPKFVNNGEKTIAVRMATSEVLKNLIKKLDSPIFMTSANKSGEPVCTTLEGIIKNCPNIDGALEGNFLVGQASTIVDCRNGEIKILREGPISKEQINSKI